jgi:hypothetical protein
MFMQAQEGWKYSCNSFAPSTLEWSERSAPRSCHFTSQKDTVPIVHENRWAPEPGWTGTENPAFTVIRPPRSESLYRKHHPGRKYTYKLCVNLICKVTVTNVAMVKIFGFVLYPKSLTSYSIHNLYLSNNFSHEFDMIYLTAIG